MDVNTGKILRVDLTNRKTSVETVPEDWRASYLGGRGLAYRYLLGNLARGLDPFDPESEIVLMTGPLAGTLVPTSSRMALAARSPISGRAACDVVACGAAAELKFAGYDGILVSGRASSPTFVYVTDQRVTFERANLLWGKSAGETESTIQQKKWTFMARTMSIGPAGENLDPDACITVDGHDQVGETGIAAVMGSKNLKAIAVRGQAGVRVADLNGFLGLVQGAWGGWSQDNRCTDHCTDGTRHSLDAAIRDSLVTCGHWHPPLETVAAVLTAATGVSWTSDGLGATGNRILELVRLATDRQPMQEGKHETQM